MNDAIERAAKALHAKRQKEGWLALPPWESYVDDVKTVLQALEESEDSTDDSAE